MKKILLLVPFAMLGTTLFAQNESGKDSPLFRFDNTSSPAVIHTLGSDPEFPFLRNLSSPAQVAAAMKSAQNNKKYTRQVKELNTLLTEVGFSNGIKDVRASSITPMTLQRGTTGNMGSGRYNYEYTTLETPKAAKAWKVTSDNGDYVVFLSACGNAFYPGGAMKATAFTGNKPACKDIEVNITSEPKEVEVAAAEKHVTKKTYIYYVNRCGCGCFTGCEDDAVAGEYRSRPLLIKEEDEALPTAATYKVTASGTGRATVCNGKPTEVHADLNGVTVEKESSFTGNMPEVKTEYIEVSKREYKRALRCEAPQKEDHYYRGGCHECR